MTNPTLITTPFAENGDKNIIPESVGAAPQNATMQAGFPPITQQKISEGGIPPERNDFNGILNLYGQHIVHQNKGLPYEFDQAFADQIGGYPLNSRIILENGDMVRSTIPNNTNNPNTNMTGWVKSGNTIFVDSIQDLVSINNPKNGDIAQAKSYWPNSNKGGGYLYFDSSKSSVNNGVTIFNGWTRFNQNNLSVYDAGVKNSTDHNDYNDHDSLRKLAALISSDATTSYVIDFEDSNIIVGRALLNPSVALQGSEMPFLLDFRTVSPSAPAQKSVLIKANGAKITWRNGMKLGTFLRSTGERYDPVMPFYPNTASWVAQQDNVYVYPASFMIRVINIDYIGVVGNLYFDGNAGSFIKGGGYGDKDWQLGGYGLQIYKANKYVVHGVESNDQPSDGFYLACEPNPDSFGIGKDLVALRNGRQAYSLTGGHNLAFYDCIGRDSGISSLPFPTSPKSNVDIEGEVAEMRNVNFYNCKFIGAGNESVVSASQDTRNVNFFDCNIEGEKSIWIDKPQFTFYGGTIKGAIQKLYGSNVEEDRVKFVNVFFSDEPIVNSGGWLIQATNGNPIFENCRFKITKSAWFFNTYTALTGQPFKLKGCTVDFSFQAIALSGVFVFEDLMILDNRANPSADMSLNFASVYHNGIKIASLTGVSALTYSGGRLFDAIPNSNIAKIFVGNPSVDQELNFFEYVHRIGTTGAPTVASLTKNMFSDNVTLLQQNTLAYNRGDTLHCTDPVARGGISKWVCTTAGYYNTTSWAASTAYAVNAYVNANGRVYKATVAGISGTVAPSHTSGTATDGTVTWEYVGVLAVFTAYGANKAATQADSTATDVAGLKADFNALLAKLKIAGIMS